MDQSEVSRGEVLRYMGCKGAQSEAVMALVEDCLASWVRPVSRAI